MNSSRDSRTPEASRPSRSDAVMSIKTVDKMLPLVRRIVQDIVASQAEVRRLQPEKEMLDEHRRLLTWPSRQRRYSLKEQIAAAEDTRDHACEELNELGLVLLNIDRGLVGFPTLVNNRRAFFSWHPAEDRLEHWQFADEEVSRPIPQAWLQELIATA